MKKSIKINALLNMVKQVMQIIFPIITIPYITRVLLPENYGKINFGGSIISYITLIAGLGIYTYAVREGSLVRDDRKELNRFADQVFSINIASTIVSYIVLAILLLCIPYFEEYRLLMTIQSLTVLFTTIGVDWINAIEEDYAYLTVRYIIMHVVSLILMFIFVKKPEDYYIYAAIMVFSSAGANILNVFYVRRYVKIRLTFRIDWKRHLVPIFILFGNSIAMTIYVSSDITMLGFFKGDTEVGIYSVATKIYTIIKQILNAVVVVAIPRLTAYIGSGDREKFLSLGRKMLNVLVALMCPLIAGIIVFRDEAITLAGGAAYISGSVSLLILSLAIAASLIATFFTVCVLMPLRKDRYILRGTVIAALINIVLNFAFIPLWGSSGAAVTTFISEVFVAVYFYWLARKEGYRFFDGKTIILSVIGGLAVGAVAYAAKALIDNAVLYVCAAVIAAAVIYFFIHFIGKNRIVLDAIPKRFTRKR